MAHASDDRRVNDVARPQGFAGSRGAFKPQALHTVLIANRGEIALRLLRCARALSLKAIAIFTAEDEGAPHRAEADEAVMLSGREAEGKGYLDMDAIIAAAKLHGAQAILPGYGFLSERAEFAQRVEEAGLVFVGPTAESIGQLGLKHRARQLAQQAGVPCVPGSDLVPTLDKAKAEADRVGYPVMLKASAGGGGLGLQVCRSAKELEKAYESNVARSKALFGDANCFVEKFVERGHHVEIQIFGNGQGDVIHLGERECSIQRRHQKIIEEAPSPFVERHAGLRARMAACAKSFGHLTKYRSAGTLEFLVDDDTAEFYFLECNTRIQVEHCVTEEVWDVDIVALMLQQADAQLTHQKQHRTPASTGGGMTQQQLTTLERADPPSPGQWAIEARLYCENPLRNFDPSPGLLQEVDWNADPSKHRIETWVSTGTRITPSYDPLLAKLIGRGSDREEARHNLTQLLRQSKVYGPTNADFLAAVLDSKQFASGTTLTSFLVSSGFRYKPDAIEVLDHGMSTSVQDFGRRRVGHGLPPSGPADLLSFRIANAMVSNADDTEALEVTFSGPTLKFHCEAVVCLAGTPFAMALLPASAKDGEKGVTLSSYTTYCIPAGASLQIGMRQGDGGRAYLAVRGGFPTLPIYLTSKSTSAMLGLGGHQGRDLRLGDILYVKSNAASSSNGHYAPQPLASLPERLQPTNGDLLATGKPVTLYCMRGPFDDDEYITAAGRDTLYGKAMRVSQNAARSGIRFECDRLKWGRADGGQGGSHPSNMLEFGYPLNGLNWNGDTPVLLGAEGPDLGGLLISTTLIGSEWRVGQLMPGMDVRFTPISYGQACELRTRQDAFIVTISRAAKGESSSGFESITPLSMDLTNIASYQQALSPILHKVEERSRPTMTLRSAGDQNLVVELGTMNADLVVRSRVELLLRAITARKQDGLLYTDVNTRTLTLRFDPAKVHLSHLIQMVSDVEANLPHDTTSVKIPYRVWRMPLCFNHPAVAASVDRYKKTVRNKAVYLDPEDGTDNRGYLARTNGLQSISQVEEAIVGSSFITVGNGFFLGTPILLPRDRRNRLRCQKYNPTRLQTAEGAFGWGGCMGAVYGVESPGGYQMAGRTLPFWSTFGNVPGFTPDRPWLLESLDTVDFYRVDPDELDGMLASFKAGTWQWDVRPAEFDVAEQARFDADIEEEAKAYEAKQAVAIAECEREEERLYAEWRKEQEEAAQKKREREAGGQSGADDTSWQDDPHAIKLTSPLAASVWKVPEKGKTYALGEAVIVLEAMKTEVPVKASQDIVVTHIVTQAGTAIQPGDVLVAAKAAR